MTATAKETQMPSEVAQRLLAERDTIANFIALVEALEAQVGGRETRYGIQSADVHAAIEDGRLTETNDVCEWLMDYELLVRARSIAR